MATLTKKKVSLVEAYAKRLNFANDVYKEEHQGKSLTENKKMIIAKVLNNTNRFLTESFGTAQGTQLSAIGDYKKFCLDLVNVTLPNMIAMDLCLVSPLKSHTGYIQYIKFVAGTTKGGIVADETVFNDPFKLGENNINRATYTSQLVIDALDAVTSFVAFAEPIANAFYVKDNKEVNPAVAGGTWYKFKLVATDGTVTYSNETPTTGTGKVGYKYDNTIIPDDKMPTLKAVMTGMNVTAKVRKLAIYYSMLAQYTLKVETGADLGSMLKEQAIAEIQYETDTEIIDRIVKMAYDVTTEDELAKTTFNKRLPIGVGKRDHYYGFVEVFSRASQIIYNRTKKYTANYMVCGSGIIPVLSLIDGFKASEVKPGPYYAGTINGFKVYVSPTLEEDEYVMGFNGNDLATSAILYAPFMPITPTQLLGLPDTTMEQGFASMYAVEELNTCLVVRGKIVDEAYPVEVTGADD